MTISNPHVLTSAPADLTSTTSYEYFRNLQLKIHENDPLRVNGRPLGIELDSVGRPFIGYGYDLLARPASVTAAALAPYLAPNTTISAQQIAYLDALRTRSPLNLPNDPLNGRVPTTGQVLDAWSNISLASEAQATGLLNAAAATFESSVSLSLLPYSSERAAVISANYNLGAIGPKLLTALQSDNRAEAWFEIRYDSNGGRSRSRGLANRRYSEADLFGLFGSGTLTSSETDVANRNVLRMFNVHRNTIDGEERAFRPPSGSLTALQSIQPAVEYLNATYGQGSTYSPSDIWVAGGTVTVVNRHDDTSNDLILGGSANCTLVGGRGNDIIVAGAGDELLTAGLGSTTLIGGQAVASDIIGAAGTDTLKGGGGNDVLEFAYSAGSLLHGIVVPGAAGTDIIKLTNNGGVVAIGGTAQRQATAVAGEPMTWSLDGVTYSLDSQNVLDITGTGFDIKVQNFNLQAAVSAAGFCGIHLQDQAQATQGAATTSHASLQPSSSLRFAGNQGALSALSSRSSSGTGLSPVTSSAATSDTLQPTTQVFRGGSQGVIYFSLDSASSEDRDVTVSLKGASSTDFAASADGALISLANGAFGLKLKAGQTQLSFALIDISKQNGTSDLASGTQLQLTAQIANPDSESSVGTLSSSLTLTYIPNNDSSSTLPAYSDTVQTAIYDSVDKIYLAKLNGGIGANLQGVSGEDYFSLGKAIDTSVTGAAGSSTLWGGTGDNNFDFSRSTSDEIYLTGTSTTLSGGASDTVYGLSGDVILSANKGTDLIFAGNGKNQIFGDKQVDLATALKNQGTLFASGKKGDLIATLDGDSTIVSSLGNDLIFAGAGHDVIVLGPGNDTFLGGEEVTDGQAAWSTSPTGPNDGTMNFSGVVNQAGAYTGSFAQPYKGNTVKGQPVGNANDTIYAGNGNDDLQLGNGNNFVQLGSGRDNVYGGMGNDTIIAGSGDDYILGGGGTTYLQGGSGHDTLAGGDGNNVILGGTGDSTLIAATGPDGTFGGSYAGATLEQNYVNGGSGNDVIYGSAGNDTLITGSGNTTVYGGAGAELITGGSGRDVLLGGAGNATIFAGSGNTTMQGGTGATSTYELHGGSAADYIAGGAGTNLLYAGDGSSSGAVTTVIAGADANARTTIQGGASVDLLEGGAGQTVIYAGDGGTSSAPTTVIAGSGATTVYGGIGTDLIEGGSGHDVLFAGDGGTYSAPTTLLGGAGASSLYGGSGPGVLVDKSSGSDVLIGGTSDDTIIGIGADTLKAGSGNDILQNNGGTLTAEFGASFGSSSLTFAAHGQDNLYFDTGIGYGDITGAAVIDQGSNPELELACGGSTIDLVGGLTGSLGQVTFADGNPSGSSSASAFIKAAFGSDSVLALDGSPSGRTVTVGVVDGEHLSAGSSAGVDTLSSWGDNSTISGSTTSHGDDIYAAGANDQIAASLLASDTIVAAGAADTVTAGRSDAITLLGANSVAKAGTGSDTLTAGGSGDTLVSGTGSATLVVNDASTTIVVPTGSGSDTIESSVSYVAPSGVNVFVLEGTANISATGNSGNDTLTGGTGNDTLFAGAGSTTGTFIAGSGPTTFVINNSADIVQDATGTAATVQSSANFVLPTNVNELVLTGSANLSGTANSGADTLVSNTGVDTLVGGAGSDLFVVNNVADVVSNGHAGDTLQSSVSVSAASGIDTIVLTGAANLQAAANSGADTLVSNSGIDTLVGGSGNDLFIVNNASDAITGGHAGDTLQSSVSFTAPAGVNTVILTGSGNLSASGNGGADSIVANAGNDTLTAAGAATTLVGGAGNDLFIIGSTTDVVVNVNPTANDTLQSSVSVSAPVNVNTVVLTGSANLTATANSGNDTLISNSGVDTLYGGSGNDVFVVNNAADVLVGVKATDTILSSVAMTVPAGVTVWPLIGAFNVQVTTNSGNDEIIGNSGNDTIIATTGADTLVAGSGVDTLVAGSGNDLFVVSDTRDVVSVNGSLGTDTISSSVSYALPAGIHQLVLTGNSNLTGTAVSGNNEVIGNGGADTLVAGSGADTLVAGAGPTTLVGGSAADVFVINSASDLIQTNSSVSGDVVVTSVDYVMQANVGRVSMSGSAALTVTGTATGGLIVGNAGQDTMIAGSGLTTMVGGTGADTFVVNNAADVINESNQKAIGDTVNSAVSYTLPSGVANLVLTGAANLVGIASDTTSGFLMANAGNDTLQGGAASDTLISGTGVDLLQAGAGPTTFVVNNALDTVSAAYAGVNNVLRSTVSFTLPANVDTLLLTGAANIAGTANGDADFMQAGDGADTLTAGAGADTLVGGSSADTFVGGSGAATFVVTNSGDVILNAAAGKANVLLASASFTLPTNVNAATITGSADVSLTGNSAVDTLTGGTGNDTLFAGAGSTTGTFIAGSGPTTFVINNSADIVQDATGTAATVQSSANFVLPTNVNELVLTGSANLSGTANSGADTLVSNTGVDTLVGGAGSDLFVVNNVADVVSNGHAGDTLQSSVSVLTAAGIDTVVLTGTANLQVTANSGADTLVSNSGIDTLVGGSGNDLFIVNNAADVITGGHAGDTLQSSVSFTAPAGVNTVVLTGSGNLSASGNGGADSIVANAGNDTLTAAGAATTLVGGAGNDLFIIGSTTDVVVNVSPTANDTLQSSVSISAPVNVNTVVLTGSANLTATANSGNDTLISNSGVDTLYGGSGNDVFVVNNAADMLVGLHAGDTITSSVAYTIPAGVGGISLAVQNGLTATGNGAGQTLAASGANDTLVSTSAGTTLVGGISATTYVVSDASDLLVQVNAGAGDTVLSSVSYVLPTNVDTLKLTGNASLSATGNSDDTNVLTANAGNDTLVGTSSQTTLVGGSGADTLIASSGSNVIYAGNGGTAIAPTVVEANRSDSSQANTTIYGGSGVQVLNGGAGSDLIYAGTGISTLNSGAGEDSLFGNAGDLLRDTMGGMSVLTAGAGAETLAGFGGDTLVAGSGTDLITSNQAANGTAVFQFNSGFGQDTIGTGTSASSGTLSFGAGIDPTNLSAAMVDLNTGSGAQDVALVLTDGSSSINIRNAFGPGVITGLQFADGNQVESLVQFVKASGLPDQALFDSNSGYHIISTANNATIWDSVSGREVFVFGDHSSITNTNGGTTAVYGNNDTVWARSAWIGGFADSVVAGSYSTIDLAGAMDTVQATGANVSITVENSTDVVQVAPTASNVTLDSLDNYVLPTGLQSLTLDKSREGLLGTSNSIGGVLTAGAAYDTLQGGAGADTLVAGASHVVLAGGSGTQTYVLFDPTDSIAFGAGSAASATVQAGFSYALSAGANGLILTGNGAVGIGNAGNDLLQASGASDTLMAGAGLDTLVGSTIGPSTLIGGSGNDLFVVNSVGTIVRGTASTNDTVSSSINYTLPTNVNTLLLAGGTAALIGQANTGNDLIVANAGSDTLVSGAGNDTFVGGAGHDTFTFNAGFGQDLVQGALNGDLIQFGPGVSQTSLTFSALAGTGSSAPSLVITSSTGAVTIQGGLVPGVITGIAFNGSPTATSVSSLVAPTGHATVVGTHGNLVLSTVAHDSVTAGNGSDTIVAWGASDTLTASASGTVIDAGGDSDLVLGGSGNDTLQALSTNDTLSAGAGIDTLIVTSPNDVVQIAAGTARDTLYSSTSYASPAGVSTLVLTGNSNLTASTAGAGVTLQANGGNDTLSATGTADTLLGGTGSDVFVINSGTDVIVAGASTNDTLVSSINETLPTHVNTLTLTGGVALVGTGNSGNDYLNAQGGGIGDTLVSGTGIDTLDAHYGSNETLVINNVADVLTNLSYYDTIETSVDYSVQAYAVGDTIQLTGSGNLTVDARSQQGSHTIVGNAGNDVLIGGMNADLVAGSGVDTLIATEGGTMFNINNAADLLEASDWAADTVTSYSNNLSIQLSNVGEHVFLWGDNDSCQAVASNGIVTLSGGYSVGLGGSGQDTLVAVGNYDTLIGGAGSDVLILGSYAIGEVSAGSGHTEIRPGLLSTGSNIVFDPSIAPSSITATVVAGVDGSPALHLSGWAGDATIDDAFSLNWRVGIGGGTPMSLPQLLASVHVGDSSANGSSGTLLLNGDNATSVVGGAGNDTLYATGSHATVVGGTGNQVLSATGQGAYVLGGSGSDSLRAYGQGDTLVSGSGIDDLSSGSSTGAWLVINNSSDTTSTSQFPGLDTIASSVNYALPYGIDTLVLSGSANLTATPNGDSDTIISNSGVDTLQASSGFTTFVVNNAADAINVSNGASVVVDSGMSYVLPALVDTLVLTGGGAISATGNADADTLIAGSGADTLFSGTGTDSLVGGAGADVFVVNKTSDTVSGGKAIDTVESAVAYTLPANVGTLLLTGAALSATGGSTPGTIIGNAGADTLTAGSALTTLVGGTGNDVFVVNNANDVVKLGSTWGVDTIRSSVSYVLPSNSVDKLVLTGTTALMATGNAQADVLVANSGNDTLVAGSGSATTLVGGTTGNDLFIVNSATDIVSVGSSHGADTVQASFNDTLAANVGTLILTGTTALQGTGNAIADKIVANNAGDTLVAGTGIATLVGGTGNDLFVVNNVNDSVSSVAGNDSISSSVSYTLPANVNTLVLTGSSSIKGAGNTGTDLLTAVGTTGKVTLAAGSGSDTLISGGGVDSLVGGTTASSNDLFVINNASDVITVGSTHGSDTIQSSYSTTLPTNVQTLVLTGTGAISGTGNAATSMLVGGTGAETLSGGTGIALIQAGSAGAQLLKAASNQAALLGGGATDTLTGGAYKDFLAAGKVGDVITSGATANVVAVNKGDGATVINPITSASLVLSLGGGIDTENLTLAKSGNNLVLNDSVSGDSITFTNWFVSAANQTTKTLQVIEAASASYSATGGDALRNKPIEEFNFTKLVADFTTAGSPTNWSLSQKMGADTIASSATQAFGGDLAYYFGKNGNITGMNVSAVQSTLTNASYAAALQTIDAWSAISGGQPSAQVVGVQPTFGGQLGAPVAPVAPQTSPANRRRAMPVSNFREDRPTAVVSLAQFAAAAHQGGRAMDLDDYGPNERFSRVDRAWAQMHRALDERQPAFAGGEEAGTRENHDTLGFAALLGTQADDVFAHRGRRASAGMPAKELA